MSTDPLAEALHTEMMRHAASWTSDDGKREECACGQVLATPAPDDMGEWDTHHDEHVAEKMAASARRFLADDIEADIVRGDSNA